MKQLKLSYESKDLYQSTNYNYITYKIYLEGSILDSFVLDHTYNQIVLAISNKSICILLDVKIHSYDRYMELLDTIKNGNYIIVGINNEREIENDIRWTIRSN